MERPQIKLTPTKFDKAVEVMCVVLLIAFWLLILFSFSSLPETIPIHYNGLGEVDGYGSRNSIFMLPIIGSFLFLLLTVINKHPELFNYNTTITPENAPKQYANATTMIRVLKFTVILVFFIIDYWTVKIALGKSLGLGVWLLPLVLGLIFLPLVFFIIRSFRIKVK